MPTALRLSSLLLLVSLSASAADDDAAVTYTSPEHVDADFALQGEFQGWQWPTGTGRSSQRVGLQVVAQGDGKFIAVKYLGGLPGDGWTSGERYLLDGDRRGSVVPLEGATSDVEVEHDRATVLNHDGRIIGVLERVDRVSPTMGAEPPAGAEVLFDGESVDAFVNAHLTPEGWLAAGTDTKSAWNDFRLHGEFMLPYKPFARGQERGNSGFYLQQRYEVQVLDSFGLEGIENECGSLYKTKRPDVNMCFPPLVWQTYDIDFVAPKFDAAGHKTDSMRISVWQNGVPIHSRAKIGNKTGGGQQEGPQPLPLKLQGHGNPVAFRNVWIIDTDQPGARSIDWLRLPLKAPPTPIAFGGTEPRFTP